MIQDRHKEKCYKQDMGCNLISRSSAIFQFIDPYSCIYQPIATPFDELKLIQVHDKQTLRILNRKSFINIPIQAHISALFNFSKNTESSKTSALQLCLHKCNMNECRPTSHLPYFMNLLHFYHSFIHIDGKLDKRMNNLFPICMRM